MLPTEFKAMPVNPYIYILDYMYTCRYVMNWSRSQSSVTPKRRKLVPSISITPQYMYACTYQTSFYYTPNKYNYYNLFTQGKRFLFKVTTPDFKNDFELSLEFAFHDEEFQHQYNCWDHMLATDSDGGANSYVMYSITGAQAPNSISVNRIVIYRHCRFSTERQSTPMSWLSEQWMVAMAAFNVV